jgi:hypothetical protein
MGLAMMMAMASEEVPIASRRQAQVTEEVLMASRRRVRTTEEVWNFWQPPAWVLEVLPVPWVVSVAKVAASELSWKEVGRIL